MLRLATLLEFVAHGSGVRRPGYLPLLREIIPKRPTLRRKELFSNSFAATQPTFSGHREQS